jgi:pimeloyl-ACP methyl ester carboxylesterase
MSGSNYQAPPSCTLVLPDGRQLGYARYGADHGRPVFYFHGLPGSRFECQLVDAPARAMGITVVALDRPGYGLTDLRPDQSLSGWTQDVAALADRLQIETFSVVGVSGGAPCALACAQELPSRVTAVALVAGLGPVDQTPVRHDMNRLAQTGFYLVNTLPWLFKATVGRPLVQLSRSRPDLLIRLLAWLGGGPDRRILLDPGVFSAFTFSIQECFRQGLAGSLQDLRLLRQPWGLRLADIGQPVHLWHGGRDRVVPVNHSRHYQACLPHADLAIVAEEGHFSLPLKHMRDILRTLIA